MPRCPECLEIVPAGSNCLVDDTDNIEHAGDGNEGTEFELSPILSANPNQLVVCNPGNGLGLFLPSYLTDPKSVQAYNSLPQSIASGTLTALLFNVEQWDNDGMHSLAVNTERITFQTAGKYLISFAGAFQPQSGSTGVESYRIVIIRKNGTDVIARDARGTVNDGFGVYVGQNLICEEEMIIGDYVEVLVRQGSGVTLSYASEAFSPVFTAQREAA